MAGYPRIRWIDHSFPACRSAPLRACHAELKAAGTDISKINTELKERFCALYSKLAKAPIISSVGTIDGNDLMSLTDRRRDYTLNPQGLTGYIPKLVAGLEQGVTTTYDAVMQGKLPPRQAPETVLAGIKGLDADALAFAQTALRLAQLGQIQDKTVKTVLERMEADRAAAGNGLVEQFESALAVAARALPTQGARLAFAADYLRLRTQAPSSEALRGLSSRHFAGEARQRLDALAGLMMPQNLAHTLPASRRTIASSTMCRWRDSRTRCSPATRTWTSTPPYRRAHCAA
jgi:hypothetical protein